MAEYICTACNISFINKELLVEHFNNVHNLGLIVDKYYDIIKQWIIDTGTNRLLGTITKTEIELLEKKLKGVE